MKRLNDAHGGSACPVEFAWRRQPEDDPEVTKFERLQAGIGMDHDACRHRIGEAEVIRRRDPIDDHAVLVAAGQSIDDSAGIGTSGLGGQRVEARLVIETTRDTPDIARSGKAMERLINGVARAEVNEIDRRPDTERRLVGHAHCDSGLEIEPGATHGSRPFVRNMYTHF